MSIPVSPTPSFVTLDESVRALLASGDVAAALEQIRRSWRSVVGTDGTDLRRLIGELPAETWDHAAWIATALGASYGSEAATRSTSALAYFDAALRTLDTDPDPLAAAETHLYRGAAMRALGRLDAASECLDAATLALDDAPSPVAWRIGMQTVITFQRGIVDLHRGRFSEAAEALLHARGLQDPHLAISQRVELSGCLAVIAYSQGDFPATLRMIAAATSQAEGTELMTGPYGAPALLAELLIAVDRDELERIAELRVLASDAAVGTEWEPFVFVVSARGDSFAGNYLSALDELRRSRTLYHEWQPPGTGLALTESLGASVLVSMGQGDEAWRALSALPDDPRHFLCPHRYVAQLRLQNGDIDGARAALQPCEEVGEAHAVRTLVDVQLLRGAVEWSLGNATPSALWVDRSLHTMATLGTRTPIHLLMPGLLSSVLKAADERAQPPAVKDLIAALLSGLDGDHAAVAEPLTSREEAVLAQLQTGIGVAAIAAELYVSPNTVKTHLRSIYRKLGVASRSAAVRKATALGLYQKSVTPESPLDA